MASVMVLELISGTLMLFAGAQDHLFLFYISAGFMYFAAFVSGLTIDVRNRR